MKKSLLLFLWLLPLVAVPAFAQESRQDISMSDAAWMQPFVSGNAVNLHSTAGLYGMLVSYRFMLTPHGALEANYQYNQNIQHYVTNFGAFRIHDRIQEVSAAYVRSFTFRNWNPFIELGPGAFMFLPIDDAKTQTFQISRNLSIGGIYGGGFAYEISPSFDIRAEYRGLVMKAPSFQYPNNGFRTDTFFNVYQPVVGIAYHF